MMGEINSGRLIVPGHENNVVFLTRNDGIIYEMERLESVLDKLRNQKHSGIPGNSSLQIHYQKAIEETLEAIKRLARQIPEEESK